MSLKDRWAPGQVTLGAWCAIGSAFSAELLEHCRFDWLCVDLQHGIMKALDAGGARGSLDALRGAIGGSADEEGSHVLVRA